MTTAFTYTVGDGVVELVFDLPGEKVNKFSATVVTELNARLDEIARVPGAKALIIRSAKDGVFVAGADIQELRGIATPEEAYAKARAGQQLFQRLADLPFPSVAAIDGACLGGGMELALACTWRVATDHEKTKLGLPEVTLGIMPGWGGTQRLPRLVGPTAAIDLILSGRMLAAAKAVKLGLVDRVCGRPFLMDTVRALLASSAGKAAPVFRGKPVFTDGALGRMLLWRGAEKELYRKTKGRMPAPLAALRTLRETHGGDFAAGIEAEARAFSTLATTPECRCLIDAFFASEAVKKHGGKPNGGVGKPGVLGAGVMGGGIAWLFASKDLPVRVKDVSWDAVAKAFHTADDYNRQLMKRRRLTDSQARNVMARIGGSIDYTGFAGCDVVVEAVVENLDVKRKVLAEVEGVVGSGCVLASNTSSLRIADMASALKQPGRLVGMHFFNPVNRMPLVEVVAGPQSDADAVAKVAELSRRCGKTAIVVRDCPGFLVNRILLPYMNEAARMLQEGADVVAVDQVIEAYGMPMGPFRLTDEVGIDVGHKVAKILHEGYGERMAVAAILAKVHDEMKLLGRKAKKGFYTYDGDVGAPRYNPDIDQAIAGTQDDLNLTARQIGSDEIRERCLLMLVNEAAQAIDEGVVDDPGTLDLAMLMGTGYPPERGGPLHHADATGMVAVVEALKRLEVKHGLRFAPARLLVEMARGGRTFFDSKPLPTMSAGQGAGRSTA